MLPYMLSCSALAEKLPGWFLISYRLALLWPTRDLLRLSGQHSRPLCSLLIIRGAGSWPWDSSDTLR
jgi:hypothetical protein